MSDVPAFTPLHPPKTLSRTYVKLAQKLARPALHLLRRSRLHLRLLRHRRQRRRLRAARLGGGQADGAQQDGDGELHGWFSVWVKRRGELCVEERVGWFSVRKIGGGPRAGGIMWPVFRPTTPRAGDLTVSHECPRREPGGARPRWAGKGAAWLLCSWQIGAPTSKTTSRPAPARPTLCFQPREAQAAVRAA